MKNMPLRGSKSSTNTLSRLPYEYAQLEAKRLVLYGNTRTRSSLVIASLLNDALAAENELEIRPTARWWPRDDDAFCQID